MLGCPGLTKSIACAYPIARKSPPPLANPRSRANRGSEPSIGLRSHRTPNRKLGSGFLCEKLPHILGIANALADALAPLGVEIFELPTTPERLFRLITEAKART
jgi:hypothetical protein